MGQEATTETATDRLRLILGDEGLARLAQARVMVVGLGGVGSSCAEALARGGVGRLVLVDRDMVTPSNVNRQALAFTSTLGRDKAEVMREMVLDINPAAEACARRLYLSCEELAEALGALPRPDYVVDAIDTVTQKVALASWCQDEGIAELSAMGGANKLDPCRLRFARIEDTTDCPLARVMRKRCRRSGVHDLRVLFSDEEPLRMAAISEEQWARSGALLGTMSYLPPIMGQMIASRVIRDLLGWA
ncbi:tRNA threonylcarbamoyladenosine dehydratase [Thermophilibacter immobilis]|jgi:tRNA A37 threonylcarbamoyladenosine dehydratase|uniref:tRNA threonylcarbamoyladenosine dehydratase n=1 Tax=Thermophilibacter immobilis TaxID=2779519 RepID=A0A7S7M728_9ACTN|nr:tRNA threonylcarbamoyladenosine dehydratase [Thermophilibacter immobilis]QOY59965.1 tRNA threonylcarbamoyladenosine dehydratase [Thermophilibacter immobilis]